MKNKKIINEITIFGVIGIVLLAIDFGVYQLLLALGIGLSIAKATSYIIGTYVSYMLNRTFTFKKKHNNIALMKYFFLYGVSLICNVAINTFLIHLNFGVIPAYLGALFVSIVINFIGQKGWVFR